ncbi:hypothetical protein CesoFtcFv8_022692 [Champsocephalus esox]|nr:hypothetical protein CesoFtcFv8_022692 [Champsocephalus esox]
MSKSWFLHFRSQTEGREKTHGNNWSSLKRPRIQSQVYTLIVPPEPLASRQRVRLPAARPQKQPPSGNGSCPEAGFLRLKAPFTQSPGPPQSFRRTQSPLHMKQFEVQSSRVELL